MAKEGKTAKEIADGMYQYESKKSSLYRKRWTTHPKLPSELKDLIIDSDLYKNTLTLKNPDIFLAVKKNKFLYIQNQHKILIKNIKKNFENFYRKVLKKFVSNSIHWAPIRKKNKTNKNLNVSNSIHWALKIIFLHILLACILCFLISNTIQSKKNLYSYARIIFFLILHLIFLK
jgi:hypothetical protein